VDRSTIERLLSRRTEGFHLSIEEADALLVDVLRMRLAVEQFLADAGALHAAAALDGDPEEPDAGREVAVTLGQLVALEIVMRGGPYRTDAIDAYGASSRKHPNNHRTLMSHGIRLIRTSGLIDAAGSD